MASEILTDYLPILSLTVMIMAVWISLKLMAAKLFKVVEWEAYASVELYELFVSGCIVIGAIALFYAGEQVSKEFTGVDDPILAASDFLRLIMQDVMSAMRDIFTVQVCLSILSTFQRRIGEFVLTIAYKVFPGVDSYVSITNVLGYGLTAIFGSLGAQLTLLTLIKATAATFFLPLGIVLRFFPVTRETGVFLIVFAIAAQVVFPMTYIINKQILEDGLQIKFPLYEGGVLGTGSTLLSICGGKYVALGVLGQTKITQWGIPMLGSIPVVGNAFSMVFSEFGIGLLTPMEFKDFMQSVAVLSLPALFMPAFSTMITIAFINATTKFLLSKSG